MLQTNEKIRNVKIEAATIIKKTNYWPIDPKPSA